MQVVLVYLKPSRCNSLLKSLFWGFKVVDLDVNRKGVWDFLLVINSNLRPISHHFCDTATYWMKRANFLYPLHI